MKSLAMVRVIRPVRRERGFTLIELSVALVVALFLLGGLFTMEQSTKQTYTQQTQVAQLQDSERLAMTILTDVIQAAGYFPNPTVNTAVTALPTAPAPTLFATAGQSIYGVQNGGSDTIYVQYMSGGTTTDGLIMCNGQPNGTGAPVTYINQFSLSANGQLQCSLFTNTASVVAPVANAANLDLVEGLQGFTIQYGVATTGANGNSVDTYMNATQVQATNNWGNVSSVKVILTFTNPLATYAGQPVAGQPATVQFERVIGIMSRMGITS
jgi:type IV pilus assembly protein PilW